MKRIWLTILAIAGFVSLYPFDFRPPDLDAGTLRSFLCTCCRLTSRGDILGNIILFLPVGFAGVLALPQNQRLSRRIACVLCLSLLYALLLQVMQLYLPSRDESLQDVLWNFFGALAGAALAPFTSANSRKVPGLTKDAALIPTVLIGAWLAYRLFPFVPSLDLQLWKDSAKPLFALDLRLASLVRDATAWAIAGYLLHSMRTGTRLDRYLLPLGLGVLGLEVLIVANTISAASVLGLLLGVALWSGFLRQRPRSERWLLTALVLSLLISGLTPLAFRFIPADFGWLPFQGFLGGSMYLNSQSALEKLFLYSSFIYLCHRAGLSYLAAALLGASATGLIEIVQTRMIGHSAEITDPVLLILAALGMRTLERTESNPPDGQATLPTDPTANIAHHESVRLRSWQFEFLQQLATKSGVSPAEAACRILDYMTAKADSGHLELPDGTRRGPATGAERADFMADGSAQHPRWLTVQIPLSQAHDSLVIALSRELGISRSRAVRRLIAGFIVSLESTSA